MANVGLVLLAFAFVFGCFATVQTSFGRFNLLALAITFWIASQLLGGLGRLFY